MPGTPGTPDPQAQGVGAAGGACKLEPLGRTPGIPQEPGLGKLHGLIVSDCGHRPGCPSGGPMAGMLSTGGLGPGCATETGGGTNDPPLPGT